MKGAYRPFRRFWEKVMKTRHLPILFIVGLLLISGCNEVASISGSVGDRQSQGRVVPTGDLSGASPAGITVRVAEFGIVATTAADGSFLLMSLPEEAVELRFARVEDGVDASLMVADGVDEITVELEKNKARTRRRGTRAPRIQLEGLITAISADSITIMDASRKMEVTCAITDQTVIRHGHRQLTTDDLFVDDRVHIRARPEEDGTLTAGEIKRQMGEDDGEPRPSKMELEGLILAISTESITVMDSSTGEQTAAITEETRIRKGKNEMTTNDLKPGDRVHVKARVEDDETLTAMEIKLQNPGDV